MELISAHCQNHLEKIATNLKDYSGFKIYGFVTKITGFLIEAIGLTCSIGTICSIIIDKKNIILAEVIGFSKKTTLLIAYKNTIGIIPNNKIFSLNTFQKVPVGNELLGRVINGLGEPLDGAPINAHEFATLYSDNINPIDRIRINQPLDVGVRAINALLTVGQGQKMGIFAGAGVGKSLLLGMITRFTKADVVIVGLIGERGREVKEFIEENIGDETMCKTVVVAAPVDCSPLERINAALAATTIAEHHRDKGQNVLLIIDSLTRYAQALRKIYLTLGEVPSSKGYSPSVFNKISQLVERAGNNSNNHGSVTAFYTVLVEGDELSDPIADHARSILDGHIILSRKLADSAHFPAIDISASISRIMHNIIDKNHRMHALKLKKLFTVLQQNIDLINMGMYVHGTDKILDEAIQYKDKILNFLMQDHNEKVNLKDSIDQLHNLLEIQ